MSELQAEFRRPFRDRLQRDGDAALSQQIFDVAKAEREPIIEPHGMGNDLSGKAVASEVNMSSFGHDNPNTKSISTRPLRRRHPTTSPVWAAGLQTWSAPIVLTAICWTSQTSLLPPINLAPVQLTAFLYLVIFGSVASLLAYISVMKIYPPRSRPLSPMLIR